MRTIRLELLRHGPPHNQLLSPLTDYLALCGDHPNTTLNFPLEHESLQVRLRALEKRLLLCGVRLEIGEPTPVLERAAHLESVG